MEKPSKNGNVTGTRNRSGRFIKGNPGGRGREQGSRNKATIALQGLLEADGVKITKKAIALALAGDPAALRLVVERLIPVAKERRINLELPNSLSTAAEVASAVGRIIEAVADGEVTPGEASTLAGIIEIRRKAIETEELEKRIAALEGEKAA